jgi:hypothetical protein
MRLPVQEAPGAAIVRRKTTPQAADRVQLFAEKPLARTSPNNGQFEPNNAPKRPETGILTAGVRS